MKSPLHGQTRSVISHDVMFKSGLLTRESPYKVNKLTRSLRASWLGIRNSFVKLKIKRIFPKNKQKVWKRKKAKRNKLNRCQNFKIQSGTFSSLWCNYSVVIKLFNVRGSRCDDSVFITRWNIYLIQAKLNVLARIESNLVARVLHVRYAT